VIARMGVTLLQTMQQPTVAMPGTISGDSNSGGGALQRQSQEQEQQQQPRVYLKTSQTTRHYMGYHQVPENNATRAPRNTRQHTTHILRKFRNNNPSNACLVYFPVP